MSRKIVWKHFDLWRFVQNFYWCKIFDGTKSLASCRSEKYAIFNRVRYLIRLKSYILYVVSHNYGKIKIDSGNDLPIDNNCPNL